MDFGVGLMSQEIFDTLSMLTPYDIDRSKVRIGAARDGGYILADLPPASNLLSFGIANDVRFEQTLAKTGCRCFLYDHTISGPPHDHENFTWHKIGICGTNTAAPDLLTMEEHLKRDTDCDSLLLKIDVEGAEWDAFATMPADVLMRFDQIVGEFHWFHELYRPEFRAVVQEAMRRINQHFTLFHVHANNCRTLDIVGGFAVADVLELSFVKTALIERRPSKTLYPDPIDLGNNCVVHDHALLFYPFLPADVDPIAIKSLIARLESQRDKA